MALKELPGGELYEENGGSYANEATARRHEAIHRQLGVRGRQSLPLLRHISGVPG